MKYANSFQAVARLELESIKALTELLENPQDKLKFIHVAGTNGKGSVCSFLQSIFTAAGYRTGKYISPNLISVCERISVDGTQITEAELGEIMLEVEKAAKQVEVWYGEPPTQFELWTAAAFLYFEKKHTDIVILETGLGGERDATNVVKNTLCSVITGISYDHTAYLGNTLREIASAKAGVIKENSVTVYSPQNTEADSVIINKARKMHSRLLAPESPAIKRSERCREIFDYKNIKNIKCGLSGTYQPQNAALAIETALTLGIDEKAIKCGIEAAKNPARFEIISEAPIVIFDGAHNPDGVEALCKSLKHYLGGKKINFVTAVMADKDLESETKILKSYGFDRDSKLFTVSVKNNPRSLDEGSLCKLYRSKGFNAESCESVEEAVALAKKDSEVCVIFGSLYLYKDFAEEVLHKKDV